MFYYITEPGDTIYGLAKKYGVSIASVLAANPGIKANNLLSGRRIIIPGQSVDSRAAVSENQSGISAAELELRNTLRQLWEENNFRTRMTLLSVIFETPNLSLNISELIRTAEDMAAALEPYYGEEKADAFRRIINDLINTGLNIVFSEKQGNDKATQEYKTAWYNDADKLAKFLNEINPYMDYDELKGLFNDRIDAQTKEGLDLLGNKYEDSIAEFEEIGEIGRDIADLMSEAIAEQFPDMFKGE